MGLIGGMARTAVVAGTATAVSNRVSRRQAGRWAAQEQQQYEHQYYEQQQQQQYAPPPPAPAPAAPAGGDDMIAQLQKLGELRDHALSHALRPRRVVGEREPEPCAPVLGGALGGLAVAREHLGGGRTIHPAARQCRRSTRRSTGDAHHAGSPPASPASAYQSASSMRAASSAMSCKCIRRRLRPQMPPAACSSRCAMSAPVEA